MEIRLTQYSHGAGCGCKISPGLLTEILKGNMAYPSANVLVGNSERDDAAAYLIGEDQVLLSTTDFFMPVVDDPFDFGRIAAANAISDIYAMGGRPILALAILGWPINKIPAEVANQVIAGARAVCAEAGITIAGGHSIDSEEPIFGLAVNGLVTAKGLKRNSSVTAGDLLLLTKPLGIGIHTTALKKSLLKEEHRGLATDYMVKLNKIGRELGEIEGVHAMTDVTGFGLAGHLLEMITPQRLGAEIDFGKLPLLPGLADYITAGAVPGGTDRNFKSFGENLVGMDDPFRRAVVCDPQTSGGLLVAVDPAELEAVLAVFTRLSPASSANIIGKITGNNGGKISFS
jgi:selenide, water dikinase